MPTTKPRAPSTEGHPRGLTPPPDPHARGPPWTVLPRYGRWRSLRLPGGGSGLLPAGCRVRGAGSHTRSACGCGRQEMPTIPDKEIGLPGQCHTCVRSGSESRSDTRTDTASVSGDEGADP